MGAAPVRMAPIGMWPRSDVDTWLELAGPVAAEDLGHEGRAVLEVIERSGPSFAQEIQKRAGLLPVQLEGGFAELIARGLVTCDGFAALRQLLTPPSKRRFQVLGAGRWSGLRPSGERSELTASPEQTELVVRQLLRRYGVVVRKTLLREKLPLRWRELSRVLRRMELQGDVRGGRFVERFDGEQFALPDAVTMLRKVALDENDAIPTIAAADPLNLRGILTPGERVAPTARTMVALW
jgi:ATP-dependent Lhr-like helicase